MSKHEELFAVCSAKPIDFEWSELKSLMDSFGCEMKTTGGSGRKFKHLGSASNFVIHEPRPQSTLKVGPTLTPLLISHFGKVPKLSTQALLLLLTETRHARL